MSAVAIIIFLMQCDFELDICNADEALFGKVERYVDGGSIRVHMTPWGC